MKNSSLWIILQRMRVPFLVLVVSYTISICGFLLINGQDFDGNIYQMSIFDAFYFVTYTATTIGFGEVPFPFTYNQRLWASIVVYLVVLSWFYSIGSLLSLLQDKLFLLEIKKARFKRHIKNIKQKYIIILGYNYTTSQIIKKALQDDIRTVVIENDEQKVEELLLENYSPYVPVLQSDVTNPRALENAGIKSIYCKAVVSLFKDDALNLRVALTSKLLNKNVTLAIKSTTNFHTENLEDLGVDIIENPFDIIASQINMALNAPNLLKLKHWIHHIGTLNTPLHKLPKGKYIICGYGRMGHSIYEILRKNNIDTIFLEIDKSKLLNLTNDEKAHLVNGNGDDKEILLNAGIKEAVGLIAGTADDTVNLSILATAKKLNPKIITMARENEIDDFSIFNSAKIDYIFMPSKILINKTANALIHPFSDKFIKLMELQDEPWAHLLVTNLVKNINENPRLYQLNIDKTRATQIYNKLKSNHSLKLSLLKTSLRNNKQSNNIVPLLLENEDNGYTLLPPWDSDLNINDKILFACDLNAIEDLKYICLNYYEFNYALNGKIKSIFGKLRKNYRFNKS
jgi:Trk K+ transport system NAD-binding subunit